MKKLYTIFICAAALISMQKANAQDDVSGLFKGNLGDVNKLINAYTTPLFKGFGNGLNGGWTNTAKTQKFLRFAIRVSLTGSEVPSSDRSYDVNKLGLANIKATNASQSIAPTFGGDYNQSTGITYTDPSTGATYKTTLPHGESHYIPAPQVQLTIGLIKNTDLTLRVIPKIKVSDDVGRVGMVGFGLKHNFAEDLGTAGKALPFDLALAVGYTRLNYEKGLSVTPESNNGGISGSSNFSNQTLEGHFSGWNAQVIISKKLLFFTPFASVGYITSSTDVGLKGNFPFVTGATVDGKPTYTAYVDPITIGGSSVGINSIRADLGFQLSLTVLKIYASYSVADYQSANLGIGLGF